MTLPPTGKQNYNGDLARSITYNENNEPVEDIKNNDELVLIFENNISQNIVFPAPNTLEFGDRKFKDFSTPRWERKKFFYKCMCNNRG